jgi:hypothetical protein
MTVTRPVNVTAVTATGTSAQAVPARTRNYLAIINQASGTNTFSFDGTPAVAGGAGCIDLPTKTSFIFAGGEGHLVPNSAINVIGSGSMTILE